MSVGRIFKELTELLAHPVATSAPQVWKIANTNPTVVSYLSSLSSKQIKCLANAREDFSSIIAWKYVLRTEYMILNHPDVS